MGAVIIIAAIQVRQGARKEPMRGRGECSAGIVFHCPAQHRPPFPSQQFALTARLYKNDLLQDRKVVYLSCFVVVLLSAAGGALHAHFPLLSRARRGNGRKVLDASTLNRSRLLEKPGLVYATSWTADSGGGSVPSSCSGGYYSSSGQCITIPPQMPLVRAAFATDGQIPITALLLCISCFPRTRHRTLQTTATRSGKAEGNPTALPFFRIRQQAAPRHFRP